MRIDLKKFLFVGSTKDKARFYQDAQKQGSIEFIHPTGKRLTAHPEDVLRLMQALKYIQSYAHVQQENKKQLHEADAIAQKIIEAKTKEGQLLEEKRVLIQTISRLEPFGNFSIETIHDIEQTTNVHFRYFLARSSKNLQELLPWLILVNRKEGLDYFISLNPEIPGHSDLVQLDITESLHTLQEKLVEVEYLVTQMHRELSSLKKYQSLLSHALVSKINNVNLHHAKECSELELENQLFCVEGWIPVTDIEAIRLLAERHLIYLEEVQQEETERTPTYLVNDGLCRVGEDVIRIFDVPSHDDKDPSLWVLFAFALFFSMIVFDAGYGLIFLCSALFIRCRAKKLSGLQKRLVALFSVLAIGCTLWGGMTHSFFGIVLEPTNPLRKHSFMTWLIEKKAAWHMQKKDTTYQELVAKIPEAKKAKNAFEFAHLYVKDAPSHYPIAAKFTDNILLELALFCGALHIIVGCIRYLRIHPAGFGWIFFIIGAYLYLPYYLKATSLIYYVFGLDPATSAQIGLQLVYVGVGLAGLLSIIQHGIKGIFESLHAVQVFGDILSYLRIYALATAAYIVAETVNHMAAKLPLVLAIAVLIFGHLVNIILSVMGGTIHGLRLNFVEWYRYSFHGGGKNFEPLQLKTLE